MTGAASSAVPAYKGLLITLILGLSVFNNWQGSLQLFLECGVIELRNTEFFEKIWW